MNFTARCAPSGHGPVRHEPIDFTDPVAFEEHMRDVHGRRKLQPGGAVTRAHGRNYAEPPAPGWSGGKPAAPWPHKVPTRTPGGIDKVTERIAAGEYLWPSGFRWRDDTPAAIPA